MLSSRGVITTNAALVECAAGQNTSDKNVFLLSELEKVWVAVAVVARRLLLDGSAVQIAPFGALWTQEYILLRDRQQNPYKTRKLCFGINLNYANRYGIDTGKVPLERPGGEGYVRVSMADIVSVCNVPARTASAALKEFFLYLGEKLSRDRVLQLSLPGVATISIKKQKVVLSMHEELRLEMYEIDSRKWPGELQREGYEVLQTQVEAATSCALSSAAASRPSTSHLSRASWRSAPASTAGDGIDAKRPVFVAASPSGRLFDDIAQHEEQRRRAAQSVAAAEREMRRRQEDLNQRIERYPGYGYQDDPVENEVYYTERAGKDDLDYTHPSSAEVKGAGADDGLRRVGRPPPSASGESIYNIIDRSDPRNTAAIPHQSRQYGQHYPQSSSWASSHHEVAAKDGPDVEVIEIFDDSSMVEQPTTPLEKRPIAPKNAELERILREEEPFSRPIPHRTYHESSAARDLIYSQPYEAPSRRARSAAVAGPSPATHEKHTANIDTSTQTIAFTETTKSGQIHEGVLRFGRKRFDANQYDSDHIGSLLQYREY